MQETLYNTPNPTKDISEYYEMVVLAIPGIDPRVYNFKVLHGWWDEENRIPRASTTMISPEEGVSYEEAEEMYKKQREYLNRHGFVHSFSVNPFA